MSQVNIMKSDEEDDSSSDEGKAYTIKSTDLYVNNSPMQVHSVYIYGDIEEASKYIDLCHKLHTASVEKDYFKFRIASPGGLCSGFVALYTAIQACPAIIEMHIDSYAASNGATLALSGDLLIMHDNTFIMFHNYSGGAIGKGQEMMAHATENQKWIQDYMRTIYQPFLTKDEVESLFKDQDIYLHAHDKGVKARITRHNNRNIKQ